MSSRFILYFQLTVWLLTVVSLNACSGGEDTSMQVVDVSDAEDCPVYDLFDSLEVISLDARLEASVGPFPRLKDCQDYFIIEKEKNFFIFEKNGAFVSSTKRIQGHGKGEASSMIGCSYNPYSKQVEILTFGQMLKYDIHLNYISKHPLPCDMGDAKDLNRNAGEWFQYIYDLSATKHLLLPSKGLSNDRTVFCYDSKANQITGQIGVEEVISSYVSWQNDCFFRDGSITYLIPPYIMNQVNRLDAKSQQLVPCVQWDFGKNTLTRGHLKPYASKDYLENQKRVFNYLFFDCDKHYPILQAITGHKLFALVHDSEKIENWYLAEVDLTTFGVRRLALTDGEGVSFPMDFSAANGYVYGLEGDEQRVANAIKAFRYPDRIKYSGQSDTLDLSNAVILKYKVKK